MFPENISFEPTRYPMLLDCYTIRYWKSTPATIGLFDYIGGKYYTISKLTYKLLLLCNGLHTIAEINKILAPISPDKIYNALYIFYNRGIITLLSLPKERVISHHSSNIHCLKSVLWHITAHCNLHCKHCYLGEGSFKELSKDQNFKLIDSLDGANILSVNITGGEPFLYKDIFEIIEYLIDKRIKIDGILTNGTRISSEVLKLLQKIGMNTFFFISLDGSSSMTHDEFRGMNGSWKKTVYNIEKLIDMGFHVGINTNITKINESDVINMYDFILKLKVDRWRIGTPLLYGRWKKNSNYLAISLKKEMEIYDAILNKWVKDGKPIELELGHVFRYIGNKAHVDQYSTSSFVCDYYRESACIMPNGDITPCGSLIDQEFIVGNVFETPITDLWESRKMRYFKDLKVGNLLENENNNKCKKCPFLKYCGLGCRANAFLYSGDFLNYDPIMCDIFSNHFKLIER